MLPGSIKVKGLEHYPGSKDASGTLQTIINQIPPHTTYIEPFLGKGTVLRHLNHSGLIVGNDIDSCITDKWTNVYIPNFLLLNKDALTVLEQFSLANKDTFVYLDPPYPISSRKSKRNIYKYEMSILQHKQLLNHIIEVSYNCMISSYPNSLYESVLSGWRQIEFESMTRKGMATEVLYMNYQNPVDLNDYSVLGSNFTDRQRIKRKIKRHVSKFKKLPPLERKAILLELNKIDTGTHS